MAYLAALAGITYVAAAPLARVGAWRPSQTLAVAGGIARLRFPDRSQ
jgi:hypothetical protein